MFYIPELKRIVSRRLKDSDFDQSHLPLVVGETSLANNSDPKIPKLVATPLESKFDPYTQCATLPNKKSSGGNSGGNSTKTSTKSDDGNKKDSKVKPDSKPTVNILISSIKTVWI